MKKLFFLKSSSSHGSEHQEILTAKRDKGHCVEKRWKAVGSENVKNKFQNSQHVFPISERKVTESKTISSTRSLTLRRSRSLSMSAAAEGRRRVGEDLAQLGNQRTFPSSSSGASAPLCDCSDCHFQLTEWDSKPAKCDVPTIQKPGDEVLYDRPCLSSYYSNSSSPRSSFGSTSIPGKVLDLYIDGENHQHMKSGIRGHRPSKATGPHNRVSAKERSDSSSSSNRFFPYHGASKDSLRPEIRHESPKKMAKDVVERLLKLEHFRESKPKNVSPNWPPMPTISCDKHLDGHNCSPKDDISGRGSPCRDFNEADVVSFKKCLCNPSLERESGNFFAEQKEDTDSALGRKLEEVKERAMLLSKELAQERPYQYYASNVSNLSDKIRNLLDEERNLVLEMSDQLQCRIAERAAAKEAVSSVNEEMNSVIVKLEREKDELKSRLHKELDRRTDDWGFKLRQFQSEEQKLRDRVRELAEQNVSLQKEVSSFYDKEIDYTNRLSHMEVDLKGLTAKIDVARLENDDLQQKLSDVQDKLKVAEEVQSCMETNYKEKEKENRGLTKAIARLQGTCSEEERTIDGLRQCLNMEIEKQQASGNKLENLTHKLQVEQLRLTEVERALRRQLETCNIETESLRHENIYLLERLKSTAKVSGHSALKLDQELVSCVQCLQNKGLSILNEGIQMSASLLGILKSKSKMDGFLEAHTLIEYDMKIQGFKQGAEQLKRSLGKAAFVLMEIAEAADYEPDLSDNGNERHQDMNRKVLEDDLKAELKAESLLTSILKEKLYTKEKELEQMQTELAKALRNHDVLKCEIQNAFDTVSCVNHKMKNLELEMMKKDGTINQLQGEVRSHGEELSATRGILTKVTQERDLMWDEVKQYSEKNMLLNREVNSLKKKIETLEEDTLLKDGQISILKDSLNNARQYNVLFGSEHGESFKL